MLWERSILRSRASSWKQKVFSVAGLEDTIEEIQRREDNHDMKNRKVGRLEDQSKKM